jgi:hypothetical protein
VGRVAELEIYKTTYVLLREMTRIREKMPRTLKYEVGAEMMKSGIAVVRHISRAARKESKFDELFELMTECELLWTWVRLAHEWRGMSLGEFRLLCERLDDLSRQAAAWLKSSKAREVKLG